MATGNPNDQDLSTVSGLSDEKQKSAAEKLQDGKKGYDKAKSWWETIKSIKAFAPLVTIIGTILLILVIIFLAIGFVGFFVTMPGIFVSQFSEACKNFWKELIGDESIEVKDEQIVELAQYIENLGYDIEGFGFATSSSITREGSSEEGSSSSNKKGTITKIDLEPSKNENNDSYITMVNDISIVNSTSIKLKDNGYGIPLYPVDVLSDANIIEVTKDGKKSFYKAVGDLILRNNISFYDSYGEALRYNITFEDDMPKFSRNSSGYTYNDLIGGVNIDGYTCKISGISYNDFLKLFNNNKIDKSDLNLSENIVKDMLCNQAKFIDKYLFYLSEYDLVTSSDQNLNTWVSIIKLEDLIVNYNRTSSSIKERARDLRYYNWGTSTAGNVLLKILVNNNKANSSFNDNELMSYIEAGMAELQDLVLEFSESAIQKKQNLYAYILANERTYTVQKNEETLFSAARKAYDPEHYGMIYFKHTKYDHTGDFSVSINRDENTMIIYTKAGFLGLRTDQMRWNLSGWTSRYGKPVELSLALHLSSMAPDFVYDFCMDKDLQTKVIINEQAVKYKMDYTYITKDPYNKTVYKYDQVDKDDPDYNTKRGVIGLVEEIKDKEFMINTDNSLFNKGVYLGNDELTDNKNITFTRGADNVNNGTYPLDILIDTSIIRIKENYQENQQQGVYKFYKAVDENGKPIKIFNDESNIEFRSTIGADGKIEYFVNLNTLYYKNYTIKYDSNGNPYFTESSDSKNIIADMINGRGRNKYKWNEWNSRFCYR